MSQNYPIPAAPPLFPRVPLIGAACLVAFALVVATAGRLTGIGAPEPLGQPTAERSLRFADRGDGAVIVTDAGSDRLLDVTTGQAGFLRGTLRGFARTRRAEHVGAEAPFTLTGYADGRLTLFDPATGRRVELEAFGSANEAVFVRLLTMKQANASPPAPSPSGAL